jgi:hypothetical protein
LDFGQIWSKKWMNVPLGGRKYRTWEIEAQMI